MSAQGAKKSTSGGDGIEEGEDEAPPPWMGECGGEVDAMDTFE